VTGRCGEQLFCEGALSAWRATAIVRADVIDSTDTAAAGDSFSARLVDALRDEKGKILAPKGTIVEGHLTLVQSISNRQRCRLGFDLRCCASMAPKVALRAMRDWRRLMSEAKKAGKKKLEIVLPPQGKNTMGYFRFQESPS